MAAACDIVVAARDARFQLAFSRVSAVAAHDGTLTAGAGPAWSTAVGGL